MRLSLGQLVSLLRVAHAAQQTLVPALERKRKEKEPPALKLSVVAAAAEAEMRNLI